MPPVSTSSAASGVAGPSYQPFQCVTCLKRFTRHENLKRHAALHSQSQNSPSFPCDFCSTTLTRQDLRRRHVKYKHPEEAAAQHDSTVPAPSGSRRAGSVRLARSASTSRSPSAAAPQRPTSQAQPATASLDLEMGVESWDLDLFSQPAPMRLSTNAVDNASQFSRNDLADRRSDAGCHPSGNSFARAGRANSILANPQMTIAPDSRVVNMTRLSAEIPGAARSSVNVRQQESNPPRALQCSKCTSPEHNAYIQDDWFPSLAQIAHGIDLFFYHVAHFFPFLHEPTFDASVTVSYLVLSMCCLGYQYGDDPDTDGQEGSANNLSLQCFHAARQLVAQNEDNTTDLTHKLVIVQAYLLLQVYSMMYLGGEGGSDGMRMHSKIIGLSRSSGLMQPLPTNPTATSDLESLWREFIKAESHKRSMLALHHMDALWYQILSVPRSISHLEIKHDMPCHDSLWTTASASEWAHRTLTASCSSPPIRYTDAIRCFLSPLPDPEHALQLELLGALNVIHFLQSSLREVSGWSAMTGRVSLDRFDALTASLSATEPYIRSHTQSASDSQWIFVEATWEMAMLETLSWSTSHMGGIVEVSLDAALATAAYLATSRGFIVDADIARSLSTHVNWFLLYLEDTITPDREPPFVTVYAFKTFLIAWQLLRGIAPKAMAVVGISGGDSEAALAWATKVFKRRQRWKVGKLVLQNLASLAESTGSF